VIGDRILPYLRGETLKARVARGAAGAFAINVAGLGLGLLAQLVLARSIGPEGLGVYAYVLAWVMILALVAKLGFEQTFLRFVADYKARGEWHLVRGVVRYGERRIMITGVALAAFGGAVIIGLGEQLPDALSRTSLVGLAMVPVVAMLQARTAVARGLGLVASALLPYAVVRHVTVIAAIGLALAWSLVLGPSLAMLATLLGMGLALALVTAKIRTVVPRGRGHVLSADVRHQWRVTMLPLLILAGIQELLNQTDVLMLAWLADTTTLGVYSIASRIAQASAFAVAAINTIFAPTISVLFGRGDAAGLQQMVTATAWWNLLSTLAFAIPMFVFAEPLLGVFGAGFAAGDTALRILLIGQVTGAGLGSVMYIMTMTGQERPAVLILGAALVGNIVLNFALIPNFGMDGAAFAKASMLIAWKLGMAIVIWQRIRILPSVLG
jgi:O-antigen/teichoic acid export membrane protein